MLSPETVAWGEVVYPSEEREVVGFELGGRDTQLVREFTDRRGTDPWACQRVSVGAELHSDLKRMDRRPACHVDRHHAHTVRVTRLASPPLTLLTLLDQLRPDTQRVRAAGVRPHPRESDLLVCALLEEETAVGWSEEEDRERTVQKPGVDVGHEVAWGVSGGHGGDGPGRVSNMECPE